MQKTNNFNRKIRIGEVYRIQKSDYVGHEIDPKNSTRMWLVIDKRRQTYIITPLTDGKKTCWWDIPLEYKEANTVKQTKINLSQIVSVDARRFREKVGEVSIHTMSAIYKKNEESNNYKQKKYAKA